jgi:hypothetical protein
VGRVNKISNSSPSVSAWIGTRPVTS